MDQLMTKYCDGYIPTKLCGIGRDGEVDDIDGCSNYCKDRDYNCTDCAIQECFDRLGEYESTGLTPEKLKTLDEEYARLSKEVMEYRKIGTIEECQKAMKQQEKSCM